MRIRKEIQIEQSRSSERITNIIIVVICSILFLTSVFLSAGSILTTSTIDLNEHVEIIQDNVLKNIFVIAVFIILLKSFKGFFKKISPKIAAIVLIAYVSILGALWITLSNLTPVADSKVISDTASKIIQNDYSQLQDSYFQIFPYQLGCLFVCELFTRLFGAGNYMAFALLNIVWLDLIYIALIWITRLIFNNKNIELLTIFLLAACLQPIFFCTFIYGNLMGLAFSMWAVLLELLYLKTGKKHMMFISMAFISIAILAKVNCSIVLIAMCIILFIHFIKKRRWFSLVAIVCAVAISIGTSGLVKLSYEMRSNIQFGQGVPQLAWAVMGMQDQDSELFPGWYNSYNFTVYFDNDKDQEAIKKQVNRDLNERLDYFSADPEYAVTFFANKTLSQWDEPTFESLWVSERNGVLLSDLADEFYKGLYKNLLDIYFNFYIEIIFFGFAIAMFFSLKKPKLDFALITLIILGGFLYHLIFEAKSQYILTYFIIMIPIAANGFYLLVNLKIGRRKARELTNEQTEKNSDEEA